MILSGIPLLFQVARGGVLREIFLLLCNIILGGLLLSASLQHSAWSEDVHSLKRDKRKLMEEVQALRKDIDDPVEVIVTQTAH